MQLFIYKNTQSKYEFMLYTKCCLIYFTYTHVFYYTVHVLHKIQHTPFIKSTSRIFVLLYNFKICRESCHEPSCYFKET